MKSTFIALNQIFYEHSKLCLVFKLWQLSSKKGHMYYQSRPKSMDDLSHKAALHKLNKHIHIIKIKCTVISNYTLSKIITKFWLISSLQESNQELFNSIKLFWLAKIINLYGTNLRLLHFNICFWIHQYSALINIL